MAPAKKILPADGAPQAVMASAPPCAAVVAIMVAVGVGCHVNFPTLASVDAAATTEALTSSALVGVRALAQLRAGCAAVMFATQAVLFFGPGWLEEVQYPPGTRLKECQVLIKRGGTLLFFTVWSWLLLASYFAAASWLGFQAAAAAAASSAGGSVEPSAAATSLWLRRLTLLAWEVGAPNALLVTCVVTFVIWPEMLAKGKAEGLKSPLVLLQHNLNTALVVANVFVSSTPLLASHAAAAPTFGLAYVLFSWLMAPRIAPKHGAVYLYFFFDPTQGDQYACIAHVALLACLALFFACAVGLKQALAYAQAQGVPQQAQAAALALITAGVCRVRD